MVHGFTLVKVHFVVSYIHYLGFSVQLIDSWRGTLLMLLNDIEKEIVLQCAKLDLDEFCGFAELKNRSLKNACFHWPPIWPVRRKIKKMVGEKVKSD